MKTPDIKPQNTKTALRKYRSNAPFIIANRLDLIKARERGCPRCGYKGRAITFEATEAAPRSPTTLTTVSRTAFLKALECSNMMCFNCAVERRAEGGRPRKRRICVRGVEVSSLQAALLVSAGNQNVTKDASY